jgi:hypothetical protein
MELIQKAKTGIQKAKAKLGETKEKIGQWFDAHPNIRDGMAISGILLFYAGLAGGAAVLANKVHEPSETGTKQESIETDQAGHVPSPKWQHIFDAEEQYGEDYEAHFQKVVDFAESLGMKPGESYFICGDDPEDSYVTQMIYGEEGRYHQFDTE